MKKAVGERAQAKDAEIRWSEWSDPRNQRKYVTRADLIQALNHALNVYRVKHTLFGRLRMWWAVRGERAKQREMERLAQQQNADVT